MICSGTEIHGWKWGSCLRHIPNMHTMSYGSTPPPRVHCSVCAFNQGRRQCGWLIMVMKCRASPDQAVQRGRGGGGGSGTFGFLPIKNKNKKQLCQKCHLEGLSLYMTPGGGGGTRLSTGRGCAAGGLKTGPCLKPLGTRKIYPVLMYLTKDVHMHTLF